MTDMTPAQAVHATDQLGALAADAGFLPGVMSMLGRFVEADRDELEEVIDRGLDTFREVGMALFAIRERKLYRTSHGTFEAYCQDRWGLTDRRARQIIEAAEIGTIVPVQNEGQARALKPVADDPEVARQVYERVAEETDGHPTAAELRPVADDVRYRVAAGTPPAEAIAEAVTQARADRQAIRDLNALAPDDYDPDADRARMERIQTVFMAAEEVVALGDPAALMDHAREKLKRYRDGMAALAPLMAGDPDLTVADAMRRRLGEAA